MEDGQARFAARGVAGYGMGLGVLAGALWQMRQPQLWSAATYAVLAWVALVVWVAWLWWGRKHKPSVAWSGVLAFLVGALLLFAWAGWRAHGESQERLYPALEGVDVRIVGVVDALPRVQPDGVRFRLAVQEARRVDDATAVAVPRRVDVGWYASSRFMQQPPTDAPAMPPALLAGDRWEMTVRLRAPHGSFNPHGFDHALWLWEQGIHASAYVRLGEAVQPPVWQQSPPWWRWDWQVERARQRMRDAILAHLAENGPGQDAAQWQRASGVVAALVTGDQRLIDAQDWEVFRTTGVAHLMAISGLHITMFAWLAMQLVGRLWRGSRRLMQWLPAPTAAVLGGVLLASAYAIFSGWGVPAQRTTLMLACWACLHLAGVRWPWHGTLLLAAVAVVVWQPLALWQAGFWLSFVAVAVLLVMAERPLPAQVQGVAQESQAPAWWRGGQAMGRWLADLVRLQWRISLVLAPLTVWLFGQVSIVGLLANVLAIPVVTFVITPLAMLGSVLPLAWTGAAHAMQWLGVVLEWMAHWPGAMQHLPRVPWPLAAVSLGAAIALVLPAPWYWRAQAVPVLAMLWFWQPARPARGEFQLLAADVGQGSAVLVQTRQHSLLYDSGPRYGGSSGGNAGKSVLVPLLRALGESPDMLVLSHSDTDHAGGAADVLTAFARTQLMAPFVSPDFAAMSRPEAPAPSGCDTRVQWEWDGVQFTVLHPLPPGQRWQDWVAPASFAAARSLPWQPGQPPRHASEQATADNAQSCVLQIRAASGAVALLTGDIGHVQELDLGLRHPSGLRADFLLVPHHGSRGSSSARFIRLVRPSVAVVQAGHRNPFGHPAPEVLHRFGAENIPVWTTPICGALFWWSWQPQMVQCEREVNRRFWHPPS